MGRSVGALKLTLGKSAEQSGQRLRESPPGLAGCVIPQLSPGSVSPWMRQNSGRVMGAVESWGNSKGTSGVPEVRGALTPCPFTTGKAALILFSQAGDLQAGREGSARV